MVDRVGRIGYIKYIEGKEQERHLITKLDRVLLIIKQHLT